jgi:transcriptional regulator GlxA family with amidase domain
MAALARRRRITIHCQGAFLLGKAGLLDNKEATTLLVFGPSNLKAAIAGK